MFLEYFCNSKNSEKLGQPKQLFYGKNSSNKAIGSSKQAHNAKKIELSKTEQSVAIWIFKILLELQKF